MSEKQRVSTRRGTLLAVALLAVALLAAGWSVASGEESEPVYSAFNGKASYKIYCMNCHGVSGKGDGYLADSLKVKPTDLTAIALDAGFASHSHLTARFRGFFGRTPTELRRGRGAGNDVRDLRRIVTARETATA